MQHLVEVLGQLGAVQPLQVSKATGRPAAHEQLHLQHARVPHTVT